MMAYDGEVPSYDLLQKNRFEALLVMPFSPEECKIILQMLLHAKMTNQPINELVSKNVLSPTTLDISGATTNEVKQYPNKRALAVEDIAVNLILITKVLEKHGLQVDSASNGKEAVDMLSKFEYDIVLMDCQMPEMDGFEATRTFREIENQDSKERTNIIALTADVMTSNREKCIEAGMDDYLSKPLQPKIIAKMLDKWIAS